MRAVSLLMLTLLAGCVASRSPAPPESAHPPISLSPPGIKAYETSLARSGAHLALAWHGAAGEDHDALYVQPLGGNGDAAGSALRLTDASRRAYEPSLQLLDGEAVVGWYERDDAGGLQAFIARFSATGAVRWRVALSPNDINGRNPVVRVGASGIHVAWLQQDQGADASGDAQIHYARLDARGRWRDAPREVGRAGRDTWNLNAALDDSGTLHLVFDARWKGTAKELQMLSIHGSTVRHALLSADDGVASQYPDLAIEHGRVALTWFDERDGNHEVYLFTGTLADLHAPIDAKAVRITRTSGDSIGAYLTWRTGRIGLAWCDDTGGEYRVFVQQFDAQGRALEQPMPLTDGRMQALIPTILPWRRGFAVAWNERVAGTDDSGHASTVSSVAVLRLVPAVKRR